MSVSLWSLTKGQWAVLEGFDESLREAYRIRLMELGFHPGETVACLQSPAFGAPRVYRVANTVFSLDDEVADHISVEKVVP